MGVYQKMLQSRDLQRYVPRGLIGPIIHCYSCVTQNISEVSSSMTAPPNGAGASHGNGKSLPVDTTDQPKLKGQGKIKKTRFSIRRQLQKHGLAPADSVSSAESSEESEYAPIPGTETLVDRPKLPLSAVISAGSALI